MSPTRFHDKKISPRLTRDEKRCREGNIALENEEPSFSKKEHPVFSRPFFRTPFVSKKYLRFQILLDLALSFNNRLNHLKETSVKISFCCRQF